MRMSCNGCRALRKGCSENCSIRPCLEWIKSPESQSNATVFLAKFYGRAGLMNLVNAGPAHLRPGLFRSLLYEACGRIVNPIYGSVGLLWSGSWQLCQDAVEAVLNGAPITQIASDSVESKNGPPLKAFDIRHVNKEDKFSGSGELNRVRTRCRFKRSGTKGKRVRVGLGESGHEVNRSPSHESSLSHQSVAVEPVVDRICESRLVELGAEPGLDSSGEIQLELTLGLESLRANVVKEKEVVGSGQFGFGSGSCKMELGLDYSDS